MKGTKITVFDDGDFNNGRKDDWTTIEVKKNLGVCESVTTFEKTQMVGDVSVKYGTHSDLDGKVSSYEYEIIGEIA